MSLWKLLHPVTRKAIGFVRGTRAEALRAGQRLADQNGAAVILNPQVTPRVGEIWRGIRGDRCRILKVAGRQVTVLQLDSGHRVTSDLADFLATYKPPRTASSPNPKRKGRNPGKRQNAAALVRELKLTATLYHHGKIGHRDLGERNQRVWDQAKALGVESQVLEAINKWKPKGNPRGGEFPAGMEGKPVFGGKYLLVDDGMKEFPNLGRVHSFIAYGKRGASYGCMVYADGRFHWVNLGRGAFGTVPFDLAQVSPERLIGTASNPSRSKAARARRSAAGRWLPSRKVRRATAAGRTARAEYVKTRHVSRGLARMKRYVAGRKPNPKGRNAVTAYITLRRDGEPGYTWALKRGIITVAAGDPVRTISEAQAQVRRAVQAGGFILKSTVHDSRRTTNPRGPRVVYNKLLGGWYVVTGPHQTPLNGRFNSKAEAQAWLSGRRGNPGKRLSVPEQHQLRIARQTLKMTDSAARIMGGPTKAEARDIILRLTGRPAIETNRRVRSRKGHKPSGSRAPRARLSTRSARKARRGVARKNPRSEMDRARDTYRMWSELEPGKTTRVAAPARMPRAAAKLGDLVSVVYESDKYDGKAKLYEHKFKRPRPVLAADPDGRHMLIVGGPKVKITADGLVN